MYCDRRFGHFDSPRFGEMHFADPHDPRSGFNNPRAGFNGPHSGCNHPRSGLNDPRLGLNDPRLSCHPYGFARGGHHPHRRGFPPRSGSPMDGPLARGPCPGHFHGGPRGHFHGGPTGHSHGGPRGHFHGGPREHFHGRFHHGGCHFHGRRGFWEEDAPDFAGGDNRRDFHERRGGNHHCENAGSGPEADVRGPFPFGGAGGHCRRTDDFPQRCRSTEF